MPWRVWVRCDKKDVDRTKCILKINKHLEKGLKIKMGAIDNERLIPTILQFDSEKIENAHDEGILKDLGLVDTALENLVSINWLPLSDEKINHATEKTVSIEDVIQNWLTTLPDSLITQSETKIAALVLSSPKRWTIYEPMLLFPPSTFQDTTWTTLLQTLDQGTQALLWERILHAFSARSGKKPLTHLAINTGIPSSTQACPLIPNFEGKKENILRSPSCLILLQGDFGPLLTTDTYPTTKDFNEAFWVSTRQNEIFQTWAPRYTMFSRGNIKEKARILSFHRSSSTSGEMDYSIGELSGATAVDLYAGIGYFAFSYAAMGIGCVLCWELNPWSVEGLRRGAIMNGWAVRVVSRTDLEMPLWELLRERPRLLVFEESNERAAKRIQELREYETARKEILLGGIIHVNCGFLPSSRLSWPGAWDMASKWKRTWLHLHENVGWDELEARKSQIAGYFKGLSCATSDVHLQHVELVKTFAPGVWHCVFDVCIVPAKSGVPLI